MVRLVDGAWSGSLHRSQRTHYNHTDSHTVCGGAGAGVTFLVSYDVIRAACAATVARGANTRTEHARVHSPPAPLLTAAHSTAFRHGFRAPRLGSVGAFAVAFSFHVSRLCGLCALPPLLADPQLRLSALTISPPDAALRRQGRGQTLCHFTTHASLLAAAPCIP